MYINAQNFGHYTLIMYTYMHGLVHYCTMKARSYNHFRDFLKMLYFYIFIFLYKKRSALPVSHDKGGAVDCYVV